MTVEKVKILFQVDKELKDKSKELLKQINFDLTTYLTLSLNQLVIKGQIPFDIEIPKEKGETNG